MLRAGLLHLGRLGLVLMLAVAAQAVFSVRVPLLGVSPDLFVLVVVLGSVSEGALRGSIFGLIVGLVADVTFLEPLGLRALIYVAVGYLCGRFSEEAGVGSAWGVVALVGLATLGAQVVYATFLFVVEPSSASFYMLRAQVVPPAVINGLLAAPVYLGLMRVRLLPHPAERQPSFR